MAENTSEPSTPQVRRGGSRRPASVDQERLVRRYLSALETSKAGRGVKRAADAIGNRITKVDELLVSADPLSRVHLTQERIELHAEYVRLTNGNHVDPSQLQRDFVRVVRSYGDRNGITYAAWRQVGVETKVLEQAGIHKAEKKSPPAAIRAGATEAAEVNGQASSPTAEATGADARADDAPDVAAPDMPASAPDVAAFDVAAPDMPASAPDVAAPVQVAPGPAQDVALGHMPDVAASPDVAAPGGEPADPAPGEVSLDELADLLAEAGPGPDAPTGEGPDQPRLGDDLGPLRGAAANRPRRRPEASGS